MHQHIGAGRNPIVPIAGGGAVLRRSGSDVRDAAQHRPWDRDAPIAALPVPVPRDTRLEIGVAGVPLGHQQPHHVGRGIVDERDASEIEEKVESVALDTGQGFRERESDHECTTI